MTAVPNSSNKIQIEAVRFRSAASESTMQSIGGAINYLFDALAQEVLDRIADVDAEEAARIAADAVINARITALGTTDGGLGYVMNLFAQGTINTSGVVVPASHVFLTPLSILGSAFINVVSYNYPFNFQAANDFSLGFASKTNMVIGNYFDASLNNVRFNAMQPVVP